MLKSRLKFLWFFVFLGNVEIIANYSVLAKSKFCFDCDSIFLIVLITSPLVKAMCLHFLSLELAFKANVL